MLEPPGRRGGGRSQNGTRVKEEEAQLLLIELLVAIPDLQLRISSFPVVELGSEQNQGSSARFVRMPVGPPRRTT